MASQVTPTLYLFFYQETRTGGTFTATIPRGDRNCVSKSNCKATFLPGWHLM